MQEMDEFIAMLRDSAEGFLADFQASAAAQTTIAEPRPLQRELWSAMADLGWLGLMLPEAQGGLALPLSAAAELVEVMGRYRFPVPYIEAAVLPAQVLASAGNDPLAAQLASGEQLFCLAWQDHPGSEEAFADCTLQDGKISGNKSFVAALEPGSKMLVCVNANGGAAIGLVDSAAAGITVRRSASASGSFCRVSFDRVPFELLLSGAAAQQALASALAAGRLLASAFLSGLARACLRDTVEYLNQRQQFDRKLSSFQTVSHRCVDMHIHIELAEAVWRVAAESGTAATLSAAKARASDVAQDVCRQAVQLHGAMGFTEECAVGEYLRLALQYGNWLGGANAMRRQFQSLRQAEVPV
ncbi:MAG: acyl-CoA/acyl-ACP dehydrogenase [Gammaproteobacteria bacterium]|nr:acyl-CoA/acyl-ACP dehydrogenase [Gammaproteobacteria bacterium]